MSFDAAAKQERLSRIVDKESSNKLILQTIGCKFLYAHRHEDEQLTVCSRFVLLLDSTFVVFFGLIPTPIDRIQDLID
jgi:hypothetical protein